MTRFPALENLRPSSGGRPDGFVCELDRLSELVVEELKKLPQFKDAAETLGPWMVAQVGLYGGALVWQRAGAALASAFGAGAARWTTEQKAQQTLPDHGTHERAGELLKERGRS